jgi:2-oxoisovalerate dehydrogenase E1 component
VAVDRAPLLDRKLLDGLAALEGRQGPPLPDLDAPIRPGSRLSARAAIALFDAQAGSRHLDLAARALRARGDGFYTIGSSGHEGNAAVAAALRPTDPAFLHYRSGAFFLARAHQVPGGTPLLDVLLGVCASADDPIAGGRHKVFGSLALAIPPQTSTIASHLPKAVGAAVALDRAARLGVAATVPADAIIACSFGDASANHSTAAGAINAAAWTAFQHLPVPILLVCEDNGIGISVRTPAGWIAASYRDRPGLRYFHADGLDLPHAYDAACAAAEHVRATRRPAFLHLRTVRLLGHAGSDVEQAYRALAEIEVDEAADPVLATARLLVESGARTAAEVRWQYEELRARVAALADEAARRPRLPSAAAVMAPLAPRSPAAVIAEEAARPAPAAARAALWEGKLPELERPVHLAVHINRALGDLLAKYPELIAFGEDVARKGGVYNVTAELWRRAGVGRVFNTLLDEQSILGLAIGAGHLGLLPIPEIQYLAYLHNAEDQLRGEAASLQFFSSGRYRNPMVVRIAGYGYQKGFGGHFHNDNSVAVLRDIPGLVIASPSRGDDAAAMLRTCVAAARIDGAVCAFLEPIALYMTRDLHEPGDGLWTSAYDPTAHVPIGCARRYGDGADLLIVSFANGAWMSLRALRRLERDHGIAGRVLDLRWLQPLPVEDLVREAEAVGRVLVVDETRRSGGVSEGVIAALVDRGFAGPIARVASADSFIPLGAAANHVLVSEADIERAALALCGRRPFASVAP